MPLAESISKAIRLAHTLHLAHKIWPLDRVKRQWKVWWVRLVFDRRWAVLHKENLWLDGVHQRRGSSLLYSVVVLNNPRNQYAVQCLHPIQSSLLVRWDFQVSGMLRSIWWKSVIFALLWGVQADRLLCLGNYVHWDGNEHDARRDRHIQGAFYHKSWWNRHERLNLVSILQDLVAKCVFLHRNHAIHRVNHAHINRLPTFFYWKFWAGFSAQRYLKFYLNHAIHFCLIGVIPCCVSLLLIDQTSFHKGLMPHQVGWLAHKLNRLLGRKFRCFVVIGASGKRQVQIVPSVWFPTLPLHTQFFRYKLSRKDRGLTFRFRMFVELVARAAAIVWR